MTVVGIQTTWRTHAARQTLMSVKRATILIQSMARKRAALALVAHDCVAAIDIQTAWRAFAARRTICRVTVSYAALPWWIPIPTGWEERRDAQGHVHFIDHNRNVMTWTDPRKDGGWSAAPISMVAPR
jgi:hypothetical protein